MDDFLPGETERGELVETGSFRVDTERMMKVLAKYQLESPERAAHELVRCAALSGAPELLLASDEGPEGRGFRAVFGGRPLGAGELSEVLSPLLSGAEGRGRHLAAAVLALLGTSPARLTLASGGLEVELAGGPRGAAPGPSGHKDTVLRALWAREPAALPLSRVLAFPAACAGALACCPVLVRSAAGSCGPFRPEEGDSDELRFDAGGRRGVVAPLYEDGSAPLTGEVPAPVSRIGLHVAGVYAETVDLETPPAPVAADIDAAALRLDASLSKCVRDENYGALEGFVRGKALKLLEKASHHQKTELPAVGKLMRQRRYRALWRARMSGERDWRNGARPGPLGPFLDLLRAVAAREPGPIFDGYFGKPSPESLELIGRAGPRTWWLQDACRRAFGGLAAERPEPGFLWAAPVLLSATGAAVSLAGLRDMLIAGRLCVSGTFSGKKHYWEGEPAGKTVWLSCDRDREFLNAFVPRGGWRSPD